MLIISHLVEIALLQDVQRRRSGKDTSRIATRDLQSMISPPLIDKECNSPKKNCSHPTSCISRRIMPIARVEHGKWDESAVPENVQPLSIRRPALFVCACFHTKYGTTAFTFRSFAGRLGTSFVVYAFIVRFAGHLNCPNYEILSHSYQVRVCIDRTPHFR